MIGRRPGACTPRRRRRPPGRKSAAINRSPMADETGCVNAHARHCIHFNSAQSRSPRAGVPLRRPSRPMTRLPPSPAKGIAICGAPCRRCDIAVIIGVVPWSSEARSIRLRGAGGSLSRSSRKARAGGRTFEWLTHGGRSWPAYEILSNGPRNRSGCRLAMSARQAVRSAGRSRAPGTHFRQSDIYRSPICARFSPGESTISWRSGPTWSSSASSIR